MRHLLGPLSLILWASCWSGCGGTAWIDEPLPDSDDEELDELPARFPASARRRTAPAERGPSARPATSPPTSSAAPQVVVARRRLQGRVLGKFRNTYYDFPSESEFSGSRIALMDPRCRPLKQVPRSFYEAVCVQGSGTLDSGVTVSFAKRDCECAEICPRTQQRICFDELDRASFPWGRGATGGPITPLLTVAVDSTVIPLGTPLYIPEYDGLPRDEGQTSVHDGCFIAQDRGMKIKGQQVDIFTGQTAITKLWNRLVPSNQGVTVVLDNPRCARATSTAGD